MRCESSISIFSDGVKSDFSDVCFCVDHTVKHGFSIVKVPSEVGAILRGMRNNFVSRAQHKRLQQGTGGQMQAIAFASQLASNQVNQLLQIHALLIAQQNAMATRGRVDVDKVAQRVAASKTLRNGMLIRGFDTCMRAY